MSTIEASVPAEIPELSPYAPTRSTIKETPLNSDELRKTETYWRACNYLSLGMIFLQENPSLTEPLQPEQIKNRLLAHWGSGPGLSFIYVHLNRLIKKYDLDLIFLAGPGHGAPGVVGPTYLEGTYSTDSIRNSTFARYWGGLPITRSIESLSCCLGISAISEPILRDLKCPFAQIRGHLPRQFYLANDIICWRAILGNVRFSTSDVYQLISHVSTPRIIVGFENNDS
jgi:hypothetical protein